MSWAIKRLPEGQSFDMPFAIGFLKHNSVTGAVIYDNYRPLVKSICASIVIDDKTALNRLLLDYLFRYPFIELNCNRITCTIDELNSSSINLCKKLGFTHEGRLRKGSVDNNDLLIYGMLKEECRWLKNI